MPDETEKATPPMKRSDAILRKKLYERAAEMFRQAAYYAERKESTWARVHAECGTKLILAAESL